MAKKITFGAVIIFLVLGSIEAPKPSCDKEESLFKKCSMSLPGLSSSDTPVAANKEDLEKNCIDLRGGMKCVEDYTQHCMEKHEQIVFQRVSSGIRKAVENLCSQGLFQDEYLKHSTCLEKVKADYESCNSKYAETLSSITLNVPNGNDNQLKRVCCSFEEFLQCAEKSVRRTCGDEAAQFTRKFLKQMSSNIVNIFCLEYKNEECGFSRATYQQRSTFLIGVAIFTHLLAYLKGKLVPA